MKAHQERNGKNDCNKISKLYLLKFDLASYFLNSLSINIYY